MKEIYMEKSLIEHCAPTLAGMKCASLFNYFHSGEQLVREELNELNHLLNGKGVFIEVLIWRETSALIYVYRKTMLESILASPGAFELLTPYGYESCETEACLSYLKCRIRHSSCFPHEIGVFLGYPLEDVYGFITNKGQNCESCGMWKVYCNKDEKNKLFQKFQKCKDIYQRVFCEGRTLLQMTV